MGREEDGREGGGWGEWEEDGEEEDGEGGRRMGREEGGWGREEDGEGGGRGGGWEDGERGRSLRWRQFAYKDNKRVLPVRCVGF